LDINPTFGVFFMAKYDERFKRSLVDKYLSGSAGMDTLAKTAGIDKSMLRRWVAAYRAHGVAGLRKKHTSYSAEFKMSVLQHMWRHELSYGQVNAIFDLREAAGVSRWERQYHGGGFEALKPRRKGRPPNMPTSRPSQTSTPEPSQDTRSKEELLKENEYLRAEVAYLKKLDALLRAKQQAAPKKKRKS
jgi:transposase